MSLPEKICLVSGASRGLAHGVALALQSDGWRVHGMARDEKRRQDLGEKLGGEYVHPGDLRDPQTAAQTAAAVLKKSERLDALVLGVGTYLRAPLEETSGEEFLDLLQTNLMAAVHLIDACRPALRASKGHVLFFGTAGLQTRPARRCAAAFAVAKSALLAYMQSLALQEAPFGVRVNMVSPGVVPHAGASQDTQDPEMWRSIPLGRPGRVDEVAQAALWLMGAEHVTGQNLEVAGGFLL